VRRDLALGEPPFVRRMNRRDEAAGAFENLAVTADSVRTVDEVENGIDPIRMRRAQRVDHLAGFGIVDFFGTETASLVGVAANGRDDMRAAGVRHLHRVAADSAGRANYDQTLARGGAEQLERPERRYPRDRQRGYLLVGDAVGDAGQRFGLHARRDRGVRRIRAVRPRHAEDAVAGTELALSRRNVFDDTGEVDAHDERIPLKWRSAAPGGGNRKLTAASEDSAHRMIDLTHLNAPAEPRSR